MSNDNITVNFVSSTDEIVANQNIQSATSIIDFRSNGNCLIVGDTDHALVVADQLTDLKCTVVTIDASAKSIEKRLTEGGIAVFTVPDLTLSGYLGAFNAIVAQTSERSSEPTNLAVSVFLESGAFDLVLDLSTSPLFPAALPPLGYFGVANEIELQAAISAMPDMVGDFEKPKYFEYNAAVCAHSRSQLDGCSACLNACATGAIISNGEGVVVDPYLCQGCGSCATVCPSGAMTYAYPKPANAIERTREMLSEGKQHVLLLHTEDHQEAVDAVGEMPGVLPLLVEEVSAFGMDYWATMVCAGIHSILLLKDESMLAQSQQAIDSQAAVFHELLEGLGLNKAVVQSISPAQIAEINGDSLRNEQFNNLSSVNFATHNNKRQTVRMAMDALSEQFEPVSSTIAMAKPAPFGVINVDKQKCTLCMACVSTCPAKALLDGQDTPALRMIEANCLQCGLCEAACPESAITLQSQYTYDSIEARKVNTLNEEEPFNCIKCQKPFATVGIIQSMFAKLDGHWMFKDDVAKRRLKMCDDCRVKDIFEHDAKGIEVHKNENA